MLNPDLASQVELARIIFLPSGKRGHFPLGTPVLQAARSLGVDIDSVCGGRGICGRCQIVQAEGSFAKHGIESKAENLSDFGEVEGRYAKRRKNLKDGRRLSCAAKLLGDCVIDVPADSQMHRQIVCKDVDAFDIQVGPAVRLYDVEVWEPNMHDPSGDLRRLRNALEREWQLKDLRFELSILQSLQQKLRKGKWAVTVAVDYLGQVVGVFPGFKESLCGLAVDVGSTTIAAHLCNLTSGEVLASAGVIGLALSFAAKDSLANLFAGAFILADAPYKNGDFVVLDSVERGRVTHIGLRSTRMLTRDDVEITIPNAVMGNSKITNESGGPYEKERIRVQVGVAYGTDIDRVEELLMAIAVSHSEILEDPEPRVRFRTFGESSLDFELLGWIREPVLRGRLRHLLCKEIYKCFMEEGIEIPYPKRDVYLQGTAESPSPSGD